MTQLSDYADRYENFRCTRDVDGVLRVTLHTNGGPYQLTTRSHHAWGFLADAIARDPGNEVVVITGTGDAFCTGADVTDPEFPAFIGTPRGIDGARWNTKRFLLATYAIEVPVVVAYNGPALVHLEMFLGADVVLAADHATFQDGIHVPTGNVPAGDVQIIAEAALGYVRHKYFLLTAQTLDAVAAREAGMVNEVVPRADLIARADEIARRLAALPRAVRRFSRVALHQDMRTRLQEDGPYAYGLVAMGLLQNAHAARQSSPVA